MVTRDHILKTLREHKIELSKFGVSKLGLFGSYIRNEETADSDIDLLVDFNPELENFENYMAVYDVLEMLFKGEKIELVSKNGLSKHIGPEILNEVEYV